MARRMKAGRACRSSSVSPVIAIRYPPMSISSVPNGSASGTREAVSISALRNQEMITPPKPKSSAAKAAREKAELARKEAEKQSRELAKADAAEKSSAASSSKRDSGSDSQGTAGRKGSGVFIVAVDPGHGGHDPGAIGQKGTREKDVTLGIAKELVREINQDKHMKAYLTRSGDYYVGLDRRSEIARQKKADLLVSLHADSVDNGAARGASVWVLNSNRASREMNKLIRNGSDKSSGLLGGAGTVLEQTDADQNPYLAKTILDLSWDNSRSEG